MASSPANCRDDHEATFLMGKAARRHGAGVLPYPRLDSGDRSCGRRGRQGWRRLHLLVSLGEKVRVIAEGASWPVPEVKDALKGGW